MITVELAPVKTGNCRTSESAWVCYNLLEKTRKKKMHKAEQREGKSVEKKRSRKKAKQKRKMHKVKFRHQVKY